MIDQIAPGDVLRYPGEHVRRSLERFTALGAFQVALLQDLPSAGGESLLQFGRSGAQFGDGHLIPSLASCSSSCLNPSTLSNCR